jgi:dUTP pyrophosphatase
VTSEVLFFSMLENVSINYPAMGDGGIDLASAEDCSVAPQSDRLISTGIKMAIPLGWVGLIRDRSSTALKGIETHAGVIDASYRGEVKVLLSNRGDAPFSILKGMRIAQMVVVPCLTQVRQVNDESELGVTARGESGFGSTGV